GRGLEKTHLPKQFKNSNPEQVGYRNREDRTTTFYITNFPDDVTEMDLWHSLAKYWRIGEVFIPAKTDKFGKRFGFARYADVENVQALLNKIEGTWFGFYKLRANLSRFKRREGEAGGVEVQRGKVKQVAAVTKEGLQKGVSFKAALGGDEANVLSKHGPKNMSYKGSNKEQDYLEGVLKVEAVPANMEKLKHSYVGTLWDVNMAESTQMMINMEGFQDIKATLLGIDKILLSSIKEGGVKQAVDADISWWKRIFSEIKPWSTIQKPRGRRIWVRIFGAPPHAWGWDCFHRIVWRFGRLLLLDGQTERQDRLDVARAQIAVTSWSFVDEIQEIKVNEELFVVRVVEERFGEIDLGVKRTADSQVFYDGSTEEDYRSETEEVVENLDGGGGRRRSEEEVSNDGWSEETNGQVPTSGYCPVDKDRTVIADTPTKEVGNRTLPVHVIDGTKGGVFEEERSNFGIEEENIRVSNTFLALTWVQDEEVGEATEMGVVTDSLSALQVGESDPTSPRLISVVEKVVGPSVLNSNCVENGPNKECELGLIMGCVVDKKYEKNKGILIDSDVPMKNRSLIRGGCSRKVIGLDGPNVMLEEETQWISILINKEVAQLRNEFEAEMAVRQSHEKRHCNLLNSKKHKAVEGGAAKGVNAVMARTTKAGRLARVIQECARGKGKKKNSNRKGRPKLSMVEAVQDSIVEDPSSHDPG
ncbi:RNA recognition motif, partial [Trifolium medium]|nr:RNA recognition motif [Trifolium medium]